MWGGILRRPSGFHPAPRRDGAGLAAARVAQRRRECVASIIQPQIEFCPARHLSVGRGACCAGQASQNAAPDSPPGPTSFRFAEAAGSDAVLGAGLFPGGPCPHCWRCGARIRKAPPISPSARSCQSPDPIPPGCGFRGARVIDFTHSRVGAGSGGCSRGEGATDSGGAVSGRLRGEPGGREGGSTEVDPALTSSIRADRKRGGSFTGPGSGDRKIRETAPPSAYPLCISMISAPAISSLSYLRQLPARISSRSTAVSSGNSLDSDAARRMVKSNRQSGARSRLRRAGRGA